MNDKKDNWEERAEWKALIERIQAVESIAQVHGVHGYHGITIQEFITQEIAKAKQEGKREELDRQEKYERKVIDGFKAGQEDVLTWVLGMMPQKPWFDEEDVMLNEIKRRLKSLQE